MDLTTATLEELILTIRERCASGIIAVLPPPCGSQPRLETVIRTWGPSASRVGLASIVLDMERDHTLRSFHNPDPPDPGPFTGPGSEPPLSPDATD